MTCRSISTIKNLAYPARELSIAGHNFGGGNPLPAPDGAVPLPMSCNRQLPGWINSLTYYIMSYYNNTMKSLAKNRNKMGVSQRAMAGLASLSFRTIQLLESGAHDPKISTLKSLAAALGYPPDIIEHQLDNIFSQPVDSVFITSERILEEGEDSWKIWLFNFVDSFRRCKDSAYIDTPPMHGLSPEINALIASTVEMLCEELEIQIPEWCAIVPALSSPWFVSGMESLKAASIAESPIHFRKRKIFVLENFLARK
ncbi:MAG: helix-turn-helix transcriptional regulator [Pseudomonadota bacterium]